MKTGSTMTGRERWQQVIGRLEAMGSDAAETCARSTCPTEYARYDATYQTLQRAVQVIREAIPPGDASLLDLLGSVGEAISRGIVAGESSGQADGEM